VLIRNAHVPTRGPVDIRVEGELVTAVERVLEPLPREVVVDAAGALTIGALAEPHAHLDKAFLAERVPNPTGDLAGAIDGMVANRHLLTIDDIIERAERAVVLLASNGVGRIRTHADTTPDNGLRSVEALLEVRARTAHLCDVEVVALTGAPVTGPEGADTRALLRDALAAGVDIAGGCPHLDDRPDEANQVLLDIAGASGVPLDLHTDETLDPHALGLEDLARRVIASSFPYPVTASHCVSLGVQTEARQHEIAELVAEAAIGVIALPHTNLFLQGRQQAVATPRGLTAVHALRRAGVRVAAGADNLQDPFNPVGRGDPLETAGLMIMAGHLLVDDAFACVSTDAYAVLGCAAPAPEVGSRADLVVLGAASIREAIAMGPRRTVVVHRGIVTFADGRLVGAG
jgi:cytosine/creatinine deaminase